jgi:hypothetical protein
LDPFGVLYVFKTSINLPFILPKYCIDFISDKYTLVFSNLNACKIPYKWDGKTSVGQFYFVPCIGKLSFGVSLCTVGDTIGMAVFGDESSIMNPQEVVDTFRDKCKAILKDPKQYGLKE